MFFKLICYRLDIDLGPIVIHIFGNSTKYFLKVKQLKKLSGNVNKLVLTNISNSHRVRVT